VFSFESFEFGVRALWKVRSDVVFDSLGSGLLSLVPVPAFVARRQVRLPSAFQLQYARSF
jgi:hypothetical protein